MRKRICQTSLVTGDMDGDVCSSGFLCNNLSHLAVHQFAIFPFEMMSLHVNKAFGAYYVFLSDHFKNFK